LTVELSEEEEDLDDH